MEKEVLEKEFFAFYETEADAVFRFVSFKVSDREIAKDIVQESFVRVWEYVSAGKLVKNKRAFVFRVASNIVIDHYRKKKDLSLDQLHEAGFDTTDRNQASLVDKLDADEALDVLRELPDKHREAIWLRMVEGWAVKDIAEHLGESENIVSVRIHRGLKIWRDKLGKVGKECQGETS